MLQPLAEGRTAKEIAANLNLSVKTIEWHRSILARKLGLRRIAELTKYAVEKGIIR